MGIVWKRLALTLAGAAMAACAPIIAQTTAQAQTQTIRIASPQRGSWEGAIPQLGKDAGIFGKHGLDVDIVYTAGGGETLQAVVSGAVDVGLSAGLLSVLGAYAKGAPLRIIAASSTGGREVFWAVRGDSPIRALADAGGKTMSYSTTGASSHISVMHFVDQFKSGPKPIPTATGSAAATLTALMTGQVDMGWAVAPFGLKEIAEGKLRLVARSSDIESVRSQTHRVQIARADIVDGKSALLARYLKAYEETLDWMYASPDALAAYLKFSGFSEDVVRKTLADFIPKESLQVRRVEGVALAMRDAVAFKYLKEPLSEAQLKDLIRAPDAASGGAR